MKKVYGYIRVSTVKQGTGVSLQEQKEAILRYAEKHGLSIIEWFKELETAAKQGRPIFSKMMKLLQAGKVNGVIIHKIDRSARNLKDWAAMGDLIDKGIEVHFAHESLDMDTRGGRLAADIQAVIASDYIRNLRDEAKKGLYGRLKQGVYPFGAPIGYINNGAGKFKTIDPIQGPLIQKAFELYASGNYNLHTLTKKMRDFGLRNSRGQAVLISTMSNILNNPFYTGVLKVKGKTFQGGHEALISPNLYMKVQSVLRGKCNSKIIKHGFIFRRLIKCGNCNYSLIAETRKGHVYYRCHTKVCSTKSIREELITKCLLTTISAIQILPIENQLLNELLQEAQNNWLNFQTGTEESLKMQQAMITQKMGRLTDAYVESAIDLTQYEQKKEKLLIESQGLNYKMEEFSNQKDVIFRKAIHYLGLVKSIKNSYESAIPEEKRKILKIITSDVAIQGKKLMITMRSPFLELANRALLASGDPNRYTPRTNNVQIVDLATCQIDYGISDDSPLEEVSGASLGLVDNQELRERMKELLERILKYCELTINEQEDGILVVNEEINP